MNSSIDLDWITLIVPKKEESSILGEGYIIGNPFIKKIQTALGIFYERNTWKLNLHQHDSSSILEMKNSYQLNFTGLFFLDEKYKEKILNLLTMLKDGNYPYHFSRIDIAYTVKESFESFYKKIKNTQFNDLTKVEFSKNKKTQYLSAYSSRYAFVAYDKKEQIRVKMKGEKEYKKLFFKKYNILSSDGISRLEIRLKFKDTCSVITHSNDFFKELKSQFFLQIEKRIKISKNLKKDLKSATFLF